MRVSGSRYSLCIEKTSAVMQTQIWRDEHPHGGGELCRVAGGMLQPYFEVHVFAHDYQKIIPWDQTSGNAIFVCVKL